MHLLDSSYLFGVMLVFVRIGALFLSAPIFSQRSIPVQVKVLLGVLMAYGMVGLVQGGVPGYVVEPLGFTIAIMVEALTGLVMGFSAQFLFYTIQFAGEVMGFQIGLSLAQAYNPIDNDTSNPIGRFLSVGFMLAFLVADGHHHILRALAASFEVVPLGGAQVQLAGGVLLDMMGGLFYTALRLSAPFLVALLLVDVSLGVLARTVPQFDLFSMSLPLKLLMGLSMFYLFLMHFLPLVGGLTDGMSRDMMRVLEALAG